MSKDALKEKLVLKYGKVKDNGGEWLRIPCPTCTKHNQGKFKRHISRTTYATHCFICNEPWDLMDAFNGYLPAKGYAPDAPEKEKPVDPRSLVLPYSYAQNLDTLPADHKAVEFLHKDQLFDLKRYSGEFQIKYIPYEGGQVIANGSTFVTSAERLIFPVYYKQALVGWQLRSLPGTFYGDKEDCIRYYQIFNKGSYLYNYDNAIKHKRVIIVEGVKKALKFPNAVATWGCGISGKQLDLLQKNWDEIIVMFDSDGEKNRFTQEKARRITEQLMDSGKDAINIDLAKYNAGEAISPDDLPAEVLQQIVEAEWNEQPHIKAKG